MATVSVNPPKTPVHAGSRGIAAATVPNVCKMPGPPAPFIPTPLPNIGKSGDSPQGYSVSVKIEGSAVAIKGASFGSMGDVASQGTGGGLISSNTQGPTKFVGPGSLNVKIEGKNVQLLGDPMLNNCGPGGSPANAATMQGEMQAPNMGDPPPKYQMKCDVESTAKAGWDCCQMKQFCAKIEALNEQAARGRHTKDPSKLQRRNRKQGEDLFRRMWNAEPRNWEPMIQKFFHRCAFEKAARNNFQIGLEFEPDHVHELQIGGHATDFENLKWLDTSVNRSLGRSLTAYNPDVHPGGVEADCCPAEEKNCAGKADGAPVLP